MEAEDTLAFVGTTMKTCGEFETCPSPRFLVDSAAVYRHVFVATMDSLESVTIQAAQRRYSNVDSDKCFGFGYRIQHAVDEAFSVKCIVDRSVVPLLTVLFGNDAPPAHIQPNTFCVPGSPAFCHADLASKFKRLRDACPAAFGGDEQRALAEFEEAFRSTTRPYPSTAKHRVMLRVNGLLPWVFGVDPDTDSGRGFNTEDEYLEHASCAVFVVNRLYEVAASTPELIYHFDATPDIRAGTSLYFFQSRAAVYMPFRWFWQCVVLDDSPVSGAPTGWLRTLVDFQRGAPYSLRCRNYHTSTAWPKGANATLVTMHELFRTS